MKSKVGDGLVKEYVVATLLVFGLFQYICYDSDNLFNSLNIPASDCAILQCRDDLVLANLRSLTRVCGCPKYFLGSAL